MEQGIVNIALAFLEGIALIVSPCILPLLPIILAGSIEGSKKRPFGVIVGFILAFALFTFFAKKIIEYTGIDLNIIRNISFGLLIILGIIMISDALTNKLNLLTERLSLVTDRFFSEYDDTSSEHDDTYSGHADTNSGHADTNSGHTDTNSGHTDASTKLSSEKRSRLKHEFFGGLFFGALLGLVWTPCAGPILAAVIVQTIIQQTNILSFLTIFAFAVGVAIPMLLILFLGRGIVVRFHFLKRHTSIVRKTLGIIIILSVFFMIYGNMFILSFSEATQSTLAQPNSELAKNNSNTSNTSSNPNISNPNTSNKLINGLATPYKAPDFKDIVEWINSKPLTINDLKGKVVLIDFWAYSCINCIRTFPYLKDWYKKYHDHGLVIVGVHSPEFDFERDPENVKKAVQSYGLLYPVALDNNFSTWRAYNNEFWPASYLIDKNGQVVYQHFGEGNYDVTENNIRYLLGLNEMPVKKEQETAEAITPETYVGSDRAEVDHTWTLQGNWKILGQKIVAMEEGASITMPFYAGKVFAVMGSGTPTGKYSSTALNQGSDKNTDNNSGVLSKPIQARILLNDRVVENDVGIAAEDVIDSSVAVQDFRLYRLLKFDKPSSGTLKIIATEPGLELYTFTFGD